MAQDLSSVPIDIHANKLLDWLISRHHCTKEWPTQITTVRQKINAAIKDMPENETIAKILVEASPINYYHCTKIVELLKTTEPDTRIFGMYGSQRMKDWQEVLKLYQKNHLYLAESASILGRNVIYEIPALKRFVSKSEQNQAECSKKEASYKKQAHDYRDKFAHRCAQLGINLEQYDVKNKDCKSPSVNYIGNQLLNQMNTDLPKIFDRISEKTKSIAEAVKFYRRFLKATVELSDADEDKCLSVLHTVIEKGNVTTYEWKHGEPPLTVERPEKKFSFPEEIEQEVQQNDTIDFGDSLDLKAGGDVQLETGGIDWGDLGTEGTDADAIDFSIETVDLDTSGIVLEEGGCEGGIARHEEALTILENADTRGQFLDEIIELEGFLTQRLEETKHQKGNEMTLSYDADDSLRIDNLDKLLHQTTQLYSMFNETKTKELLLVHESERYVTRLAESLLQNLKLAAKLEFRAEQSSLKYIEIAEEIKQCSPKVTQLTKVCRELQTQLTKEISAKYNNRPVYITGGV